MTAVMDKKPIAIVLPTPEIIDVTPELAEEWLTHNTHNRSLQSRRVEQYAEAMRRGEWRYNGDAIRFDLNGTILDGQHRLWAVVFSEVTIKQIVVRGLEPGAQDTIDFAARRNLADTLKLAGEVNQVHLAAVINTYWRRINGLIRNPNARPSVAQARDVLTANPGLREAVKEGTRMRDSFRFPESVAGAVYYELCSVDAADAAFFWEKLESGVGLEKGSPILLLRKYLEGQALNQHQKASGIVTYATIVKAWNYWREGRIIDRLFWRAGGSNGEPFPEAR